MKIVNNSTEGYSKILSNTLVLFFRLILTLFFSLIATRLLLQNLGVSDYGLYTVIGGIVVSLGFIKTSISAGNQRFFNIELGKGNFEILRKIFGTSKYIQLLFILFILFFSETIGLWFLNNYIKIPDGQGLAANIIYQASIISFCLTLLNSPYEAIVLAHEKMTFYATINIIDSILKLLIVYSLIFFPNGRLVIYSYLVLLISILDYILYWIYCRRFIETHIGFKKDKEYFSKLLGFSGWTVFGALAATGKGQGLNIVLNILFGTIVNAARGVACQIDTALAGFTGSFTTAFRPQLIQSHGRGDIKKSIKILFSASKLSYFLILFLAIPIVVELKSILSLWLGKCVPDYTIGFTLIILCITLINCPTNAITTLVQASGKLKHYQIWSSGILLSIVPVAYFTGKISNNPLSIYIVSLLITFVADIARVIIMTRIIPQISAIKYIGEVYGRMIILVMLSLSVPVVIHNILDEGFIRLICVFLISWIFTPIFIWLVAINNEERTFLKELIYNKFIKRNGNKHLK